MHYIDPQHLGKRHAVLPAGGTVLIAAAEIQRAIKEAVLGERIRCVDIVRQCKENVVLTTSWESVAQKILGNEKRGMYGGKMTRDELKTKIENAWPKFRDVKVDDSCGDATVLITAIVEHNDLWPHAFSKFYTWLDQEAPTGLVYQVRLSWR